MAEREDDTPEFSDEELEALAGEEPPDRKAMSAVTGDPGEFAGLGVEDIPRGSDPERAT